MVGSLNGSSDSIYKFNQTFGSLMSIQYTIQCAKKLVEVLHIYPAISGVGAVFCN